MHQCNEDMAIYDYVICGGGTAGCVIAGRLAEDPQSQILVIEAGGPKESVPMSSVPAAVAQILGTEADWQIWSEPNASLDHRRLHLGRGKFLGGTSGTNGTLCIRGSKEDYDAWGLSGWSGEDMFRCMSKAETFCNKSWFKATDDYHGRLGPLRTTPHDNAPISDLVLDSFQERGLPLHPDMFTTGGIANGCGHAVRTVHNGVRTTAADYITGEHARSNVSIKTNCFVNRLILEERERSLTAAGVELVSSDGEKSRVMARKEVIISAGVYGSPPILMRSGIGAKEEVEKHGIVHRVELPGVGKNLMDHMVMLIFYEVSQPSLTHDRLVWHTGAKERSVEEYKESRTGFMSQFPFGSFAYARLDDRLKDSPLWQQALHHKGLDPMGLKPMQPHVEMWNTECYSPKYLLRDFPSDNQHAFALAVEFFSPQSRGHVTLKSSNPLDNPVVDHNYLSEPLDMLVFSEGCALANEIVMAGSATKSVVKGAWPDSLTHHRYVRREEWEAAIRSRADTCYHPAGTCKMGKEDDRMAVLDAELRVRGVANLRVADASVMPLLMTGHPQMACYGIGERAAELIKSAA